MWMFAPENLPHSPADAYRDIGFGFSMVQPVSFERVYGDPHR